METALKTIQKRGLSLILVLIVSIASSTFVQLWLEAGGARPYSTSSVPIVVLIMMVMVLCWVFEIFPLWFTSLMPLIIAPLFDVMSVSHLAPYYLNDVSFLFFSGFLLGQVIAEWNIHMWLSNHILKMSRSNLVVTWLSLTCLAFFLSMWIANVVAAIMLMSVSEALILQLKSRSAEQWVECKQFATALVLSIAYASSLGGIATLIGTAPNALLGSYLLESHGLELTMYDWLIFVAPFAVMSLGVLLIYIYTTCIASIPKNLLISDNSTHSNIKTSPLSGSQWVVIIVFATVVSMWMGKSFLKNLLHVQTLSDAWIGLLGVGLLNLIPSSLTPDKRIMSKKAIRSIPWDILLLIGGGMCLAKLMSVFNVDRLMIDVLTTFQFDMPWLLIIFAIVFMNVATEITSNTAITIAALPIFYTLAKANNLDVLDVMIPATISASMAFMLPTATPPNAVSFATGYVNMKEMIRIGFFLKILIIMLSIAYFSFL